MGGKASTEDEQEVIDITNDDAIARKSYEEIWIPPSDRAGPADESGKATLLKPTGPTTVDRKKLAVDTMPVSVTRSPIAATPVSVMRSDSSNERSRGLDERVGRNEPEPPLLEALG